MFDRHEIAEQAFGYMVDKIGSLIDDTILIKTFDTRHGLNTMIDCECSVKLKPEFFRGIPAGTEIDEDGFIIVNWDVGRFLCKFFEGDDKFSEAEDFYAHWSNDGTEQVMEDIIAEIDRKFRS
jgi:hypothetical protein